MKRYFIGGKEVTHEEMLEYEKHWKEVIRHGTIKELLELVPIKVIDNEKGSC